MSRPPSDSDWRRQGQERYLRGARLVAREYRAYRPGWDHDHCAFCGSKFSQRPGDLSVGYSTEDEYHWICAVCFTDFSAEFGWQVVEE
jgi:hypothetical protein